MQYCDGEADFGALLAEERPRFVRLCAWFTGSRDMAEDLAQETLVAAWKSRDKLTSLDKLKPWTSAIARNICLHWARGHAREKAHLMHSLEGSDLSLEDDVQDETDLELELDRTELVTLLDRALALLPPKTGQMLVEHYIKESSHSEIAAMMNLKPGAVAVRLQRGKLTLQRYLRTRLKEESLAFGLIGEESTTWEETNIWCLSCGQIRLLGRYRKNETFALRCPHCSPEPERIMAGLDLSHPYHASLLGKVKSYKPAYSRMLKALAPLYRQALQQHNTACPACGTSIPVHVSYSRRTAGDVCDSSQLLLVCPACGWASNKTLSGLVLSLPDVQRFWRDHPRLIILPEHEVEVQGSPALLTRLRSMTTAAELNVVSLRETFETLQVHANVTL